MSDGSSGTFVARPFPDSAWADEWRKEHERKTKFLPQNWFESVALAPPPPAECIAVECRAVLAASHERASRLEEIVPQAKSYEAILRALECVLVESDQVDVPADTHEGVSPRRPHTRKMILAAFVDLNSGLFQFKIKFNRGRPYHCCDLPLEPMFMRPDPLYPGHPSYPSGHSTQAHVFALLYAEIFPGLRAALLSAAYQVGRNREIAGVHYGSDTDAGRELAIQFVDLLLANQDFRVLLKAAQEEWWGQAAPGQQGGAPAGG